MESNRLDTRVGSLAWQSSGEGPTLVFFAGALANHDLWRDVIVALEDRYRCITIDLPLGAHPRPLSAGADRSATSLARLLLARREIGEERVSIAERGATCSGAHSGLAEDQVERVQAAGFRTLLKDRGL
jgi:pimeloyl-ACP methyl ester carboxylesterase